MEDDKDHDNSYNPEEIKTVIKSLYDTFTKYLNPHAIINHGAWIDCNLRINIENQSTREAAVESLLAWILYDDETESSVINFTRVLTELTHDSDSLHPAIINGNSNEALLINQHMKHLVSFIDGSLLRKLSHTDVWDILNVMMENKIITERVCKQAKGKESPYKCLIEMLKNIRKGKPEWPLVFFQAINENRPVLLQNNTAAQNSDQSTEVSQVTLDNQLHSDVNNDLTNQEAYRDERSSEDDKIFETLDAMSSLSSITQSEIMFQMLKEENPSPSEQILLQRENIGSQVIITEPKDDNQAKTAQLMPNPCNDHIVDKVDSDKQLTDETDADAIKTERTQVKRQKLKFSMTEEEFNSNSMQELVKSGNIDHERIIIVSEDQKTKNRQLTLHGNFSDEEEDEKDADEAMEEKSIEEAPNLHLRDYQNELAANALKGLNTIICAPTGSGKTRVATHIILNHLRQKAGTDTKKRKIAFLARTVPLVMQQCKSLKKYLPKKYEVTHLTGDSEDSMHLHLILPDNDVIVMTPRILENHLNKKCLSHLGEFSMLVFDECHHTRKGEPYNTLMYSYLKTKKLISEAAEGSEFYNARLPQIVGLTASISVEKAVKDEEAVKYILQVCGSLDVDIISGVEKYEEELKRTVPVPKEVLTKLRERESEDEAVQKINKILGELEKSILHHATEVKDDKLNSLVKKIPSDKKSQQYGQWAVKIRNAAKEFPREENRETHGSVRALIILADYLSAYNVALELYDLVLLGHVMAYLDRSFAKFSRNAHRTDNEQRYYGMFIDFKDLMKNQLHADNWNLKLLKKTLSDHLIAKGNKSCGIIFVKTRALAEALTSWLNNCNEKDLVNLKATTFTGTAASVENGGMTTAEQDEIIRQFKSGVIRLLVATSVGEEGIDIPECNLVIKYNHVGNEVTTVQTRGRSRKEGGMSILLAMDNIIRKERINQEKAKMMERAIRMIREMKRSKIRKIIREHQQRMMKDEEILQIVKQQEKDMLLKKPFKMVCHMCRKVVIDSSDIKTIFDTHHVVVNRNIREVTTTLPSKTIKNFDELRIIGSVICKGQPEEGKYCYNKLGSMMVFAQVHFVVLTIKNFGFDTNSPSGLEFYNQWKKVPYAIEEINASDFKRYLPEKKREIEKESDSEDEDNDDNNVHGDEKGQEKASEPDQSLKEDKEHLSSTTEQKRETQLQNDASPVGANLTYPKILVEASQNDKKDSGLFSNSGSGTEYSKPSSVSVHTSTAIRDNVSNAMPVAFVEKASSISNQPLEMPFSTSNRTFHQTSPMDPCMVERNSLALNNPLNLLFGYSMFESKFSSLVKLSSEPEYQCSIDSNDCDSQSSTQSNNKTESLEDGSFNKQGSHAVNDIGTNADVDGIQQHLNLNNRTEKQQRNSNEIHSNTENKAQCNEKNGKEQKSSLDETLSNTEDGKEQQNDLDNGAPSDTENGTDQISRTIDPHDNPECNAERQGNSFLNNPDNTAPKEIMPQGPSGQRGASDNDSSESNQQSTSLLNLL